MFKPIHYLFYTQPNHYAINNYWVFSDRLSPITKFITDVEHQANSYHEEWQNMNEILTELQSVRRELHNEMKCFEDLFPL